MPLFKWLVFIIEGDQLVLVLYHALHHVNGGRLVETVHSPSKRFYENNHFYGAFDGGNENISVKIPFLLATL